MKNLKLSFDFEATRKFLFALAGRDDEKFIFQTFDDVEEGKNLALVRTLYGTFKEHKAQLQLLNESGAGVFVTINKSNGSRRKGENIIGLRALFVDKDNGPLCEFKILPSILVQSKRGPHPYFLLKEGELVNRFTASQKALIHHLNADPKVHDLPRVMRLPGFNHLKIPDHPFLVELITTNEVRYTIDEVLNAYPLPEGGTQWQKQKSRGQTRKNDFEKFKRWASKQSIEAHAKNPHGGRNNALLFIIREGLGQGISSEQLKSVVLDYCERSDLEIKTGMEMLDRMSRDHEEEPFSSFASESKKLIAADVAETFLVESGLKTVNELKLRWWNTSFYRFCDDRYMLIPRPELKANIVTFLQQQPKTRERAGSHFVNDILANVEAMSLVPSSVSMPAFVEKTDLQTDGRYVSLKNGLLNLDDLLRGRSNPMSPHTSAYFSTACLPYEYDVGAKCPRWLSFLEKMVPDKETRQLLQEWFGYNLTFDIRQQKFIILVGEGANGKSVICIVLRMLLGPENVSAVSLEAFNPARTFPLSATLGKLANIVEEIGETDKAAEGLLKDFVTGGRMTIEKKHRDAFEIEPTARITFATNVLPRFKDRTAGLWRRMLVVPLDIQIIDEAKQDKRLIDSKWWAESGELPGIFNWAIEGLKRLHERGQFLEPVKSESAKSEYRADVNPAATFLIDHCAESEGESIAATPLYRAYAVWTEERGARPLGESQFAKEVRRAFRKVTLTPHPQRQKNGRRCREWLGIGWTHGDPFEDGRQQ